ncbi:MAG: hypothetical protein ABIQ88_07395 [Chitinophagaceae bacterium]
MLTVSGFACKPGYTLSLPPRPAAALSGSAFYKQAVALRWDERESIALKELLAGDIPNFLKKFVPVTVNITAPTGKKIQAVYFVMPDYLSIGSNEDFARLPLTPVTAQIIADSFQCFLPTRKMVNDIYQHATVKLEPVPLYAFRDSSITFWHHHLIIEGQRKGRKGLIAGVKKDVVISGSTGRHAKPDREAIYGWHQLNGQPIQPLYTGHINWWVDYSHGIRLVYRKIKINGHWMDYKAVLQHPVYKAVLCDEIFCDCYRY